MQTILFNAKFVPSSSFTEMSASWIALHKNSTFLRISHFWYFAFSCENNYADAEWMNFYKRTKKMLFVCWKMRKMHCFRMGLAISVVWVTVSGSMICCQRSFCYMRIARATSSHIRWNARERENETEEYYNWLQQCDYCVAQKSEKNRIKIHKLKSFSSWI